MRKIYFILVLSILTLASCISTEKLTIEVAEPAKVNIDKEIKNILLVNANFPPDYILLKRHKFIYNGIIHEDKSNLDSLMNIQTLQYLSIFLEDAERFNIVNDGKIHSLMRPVYEFGKPIKSSTIIKLCDTYNADAVLILDNGYAREDISYDYYYGDVYKEIGALYKIALNLYLNDGFSNYSKTYTDTLFYNYNGYYDIEEKNYEHEAYIGSNGNLEELNKRQEDYISRLTSADEAALISASDFSEYISPIWKEKNRMYYTSLKKEMVAGEKFAKKDQWKDAAVQWKKLTDHRRKHIRGYSMFNLALACEMEGNIELAIYWARKSYKELESLEVSNYVKILDKRATSIKKLNKQTN